MTNYSFDETIPATNNNPSTDQPGMLINNVSTKGIISTDHVTFGLANGGSHLQNTFYAQQSPSIGSSLAILYPGARPSVYSNSTGSSATNTYLLNTIGVFPTSMIKAGGTFVTTNVAGNVSMVSQFNLNVTAGQIITNGTGLYTINLLTGATTGDNVIVLPTIKEAGVPGGFSVVPGWNFTGNVLKLNCGTTAGITVTFIILQI